MIFSPACKSGFGGLYSTRVSNELSAGNPKVACLAFSVVMFLTISQAIVVS
ncbi:hypothetical protein TorRG33x02_013560, partial [Trema orientale]